MNDVDSRVAREVADVERHNLANTVGLHDSGKPRVMYLNSVNAVLNDRRFPGRIGTGVFVENRKEPFKLGKLVSRFLNRKSLPVVGLGPCGRVPEFRDILNGDHQSLLRSISIASARTAEACIGLVGCTEPSRRLVSMRIGI